MTLREFNKYGGTVPACMRALAKQRIAAGGAMGLEKKRYVLLLVSSIVYDSFKRLGSGKLRFRKALTKRKHAMRRPVRVSTTSSTARTHLITSIARLAPPSPLKPPVRLATNRTPMTNRTTNKTLMRSAKKNQPKFDANYKQGRFASPAKSPAPPFRVPSTAFNPILPKTPSYPKRIAKWNESVMSINGTPLAFPRHTAVDDDDAATVVSSERGSHAIIRKDHTHDNLSSRSSSSTAHSTTFTGPTITIPTAKGQVLQFDPISMSPGSFEKLPGLTDSAKKHAKDEMMRIVQNLAKWHI